ncbi:hypothetical protein FSE01_22305, partial [Salmonella enterica subsp. enterica]|nr:hypothetical protein [Salmonella enterica subsp. enterica serovar Veneziana]
RRSALEVLLESGLITPDYMVKAIILNDTDALFASVTENNDREDMHPSDLIGAFTLFVERGHSVGDIALKFGYSSRYVNQMLRLSSMAPKLIEFLAEDKISVEQLQALAICDNHEKQVLAWNNSWNKDGGHFTCTAVLSDILVEHAEKNFPQRLATLYPMAWR